MASGSLVDYYNSRVNFNKINPVIRSAYNISSDFEDYKSKLLAHEGSGHPANDTTVLDSIEGLRREQRLHLARVEHDYYSQRAAPSFDVPYYPQEIESKQDVFVPSKPPLPTGSRRSPSPVFVTDEHAHLHSCYRPMSANSVRQHHSPLDDSTLTMDDFTTSRVHHHIENMWNDLDLDDYREPRKARRPLVKDSWAGRVTVPEPFALTDSTAMGHLHRKKCAHSIEAAKLQKEVDEEVVLNRPFRARPVPAHVHMPLYEQLQDEQRARREQVRHMTTEYLHSISKPFGFDSRERANASFRRHSFSGNDTCRREPQFKATPLPDFYSRTSSDIEQMKEKSLYRSIKKEIRAQELLRQSRLPSSMQHRQQHTSKCRRSMSASDLARLGREEYTFKPKTNGYHIPDYDRQHAKFLEQCEEAKRMRPTTKCQPFLLHTDLISSKRDRVLDDIRHDEQMRRMQSFQIKGKQLPPRSASGMSLSASLQQPEAIPTKTTDIQELRVALNKKKRHHHEIRSQFEANFQRSRSAKGSRSREHIQERAKSKDRSVVQNAKKAENARLIRQSLRHNEDDYARRLDEMNQRVDRRPLLQEQNQRDRAACDLERKIQRAMKVAKITEEDLMRKQFNPPNVKVTRVRSHEH